MKKIYSVSARALAEFAFEKGDLIPSVKAASLMQDGVRGHRVLQDMLPPNWQAEVPVSRELEIGGRILRIHGRADALYMDRDVVRVLEIKTTVRNPRGIMKFDYPAHWAQGEIYACLFCLNHGIAHAEVHLTYARLDGSKRQYREEYMAEELLERLMAYAAPYLDWVSKLEDWKERSRPTIESLPFPFDRFREGQRDMAAQVFRAMKSGANALIEAPTGIGKTAASLFGALKALGQGAVTRIFYLTARTTGRRSAEDALMLMRGSGLAIRSVTITAKEKICFLGKADCLACPYASGYFDRRRDALKRAMDVERLDAEAIGEIASEYEICPFELSLDLSETADVVICDYNYVFDPRVRLKRHFEGNSRAGLLIDEAHNLADRTRGMLSVEINGAKLAQLRGQVVQLEGKESPLAQEMTLLLRALANGEREMEACSELPEELFEAIQRFAQAAAELEIVESDVSDFAFDAQWFVRVAKQFNPDCYRAMILPGERFIAVRLWCFDPSAYLKKALSRVGGAALFSATLAPMSFYAQTLGADGEEDTQLVLESPFPRENLFVARLSVAVSMKERERTLNAVCQVIRAMAQAHPGNYIACFPSYAYLALACRRYRMLWPDDSVIAQESRMTEAQRAEFIERFEQAPRRSMVAFIVLGGVFAEGIDLPDERLSGAAIVTTGMPQISFEREQMSELLDDGDGGGRDAAYTYPGMRRVLQAAGRVIRTETDRGAVLLIDARYRQPNYRELIPPHWDVQDVKKMSELNALLRAFWQNQ